MHMDRRKFLKFSAMSAALAALGGVPPTVEERDGMPYRVLGATGEHVSLLGIGGAHIGRNPMSDDEAVRAMRKAVDAGVNFFDNAYIYENGRSEERMGKALQDGYRDQVFLMTKFYSTERDAAAAKQQLEESLRRLQTDVIDLWQVHQIYGADHPRLVYENDLPEVMEEARREGKVRYTGFTGHSRPEYHAEMIERGYAWDTVQMPLNPFDHHWESFEHTILPMALERDMGVIGMKSLGGTPGQIVNNSGALSARECIHYAMNLPVSTVVLGMERPELLDEDIAIAKEFRPLEEDEVRDILAKAEEDALTGEYETYKERV